MLRDEDICALERIMPGCVLVSGDISEDYSRDEMTEYGRFAPEAVLLPVDTEQVSAALAHCNRRGIPVTARGSGTGLCGGCVPIRGGVVLSTERMKRVIEVDADNMVAVVEPGVLLMEFAKKLEGTGLFYPPDPGEKSATLGGNAMTNAGGMRAVRYGVTRDYVLGMQVVLASGEVLELGGKLAKNASGYSLLHLLIGSEGTLGICTRLTLKLIAEPQMNLSVLAPFDEFASCIRAVPDVVRTGEPTAVEFMQRGVIQAAESYLGKRFPDVSAEVYLLIRLDGASRQQLQPRLEELTALLVDRGAKDVLLADTDERKAAIWDARGAFLEAIAASSPSMDECDVVVPRSKIAEFVERTLAVGDCAGLRLMSFGHAGDGNLHVYVMQDEHAGADWERRRAQAMDMLYEAAQRLGGQVSGEHGIGHAKVPFLRASLGETQLQLMRDIKRAFDPNHILNPGKVVG